MIKKLQLILFLLFICTCLQAQITISGILRDAATQQPIANANVMLQNKAGTTIYAYTSTSDDGKYSLECNVRADSLLILITGFNDRET